VSTRSKITATTIASTIAVLALAGVSAFASDTDSTKASQSSNTESTAEECYCSVRKRQQVKARLDKKENSSKGSVSIEITEDQAQETIR